MFRLMGIVFVDWNLVWVWGLKIRGGKSLLIGIADWNFSLLMGIVFLGVEGHLWKPSG